MTDLMKKKKKELIEMIQYLEETIEGLGETKYDVFKEEIGLPYNTDDEWIDYIKRLQTINATRSKDCKQLIEMMAMIQSQHESSR